MNTLDLRTIFTSDNFLSLSRQMSERDVIRVMGLPSEVEDYGEAGKFLHYGSVRFSISGNHLDYVDCFFLNTDLNFKLNIDDQEFLIDKDCSVLTLIQILNMESLEWSISSEQSKLDYFVIDISKGTKVFYYLYKEKLERITKEFR
jgi:hypothetical protein